MMMFFEIISWIAAVALVIVAVPQIILNFQRKSVAGVSGLMFGLLFFGMTVLCLRSLYFPTDLIIRLNYGLGALVALAANLQIFCYRVKGKK